MKALHALVVMVGVIYLAGRAIFTWQGANLVLFCLLLAAEAYGVVRSHVELSLARPKRRSSPEPLEEDEDEVTADVLVLAVDETVSEVRAAVLAARAIRGSSSVTLVDCDGRPDLIRLAQRLAVGYLSDSGSADVGGLLTRAMDRGSSPRIVVVAGDVVILPDIATVVEPRFSDPEVAVVVGRTEAANADHPADCDGYGQSRERDMLVSPTLDEDHALPWWNGVSVIRREAIEEIGGLAPDPRRVTLATGVRLQAAGWRMADSGLIVARRLVSWTDRRHLHRWSRDLHERLAVLRREDISWNSKQIDRKMRFAYRSALIDGTRPLQRLLLIGILAAVLAGAGFPANGPIALLAGAWAGQMGLRLLARFVATRSTGFRSWIIADLRLLTTELIVGWRVLRGRGPDDDLFGPAPGNRSRALLLWTLEIVLAAGIIINGLGLARGPEVDVAMVVALAAAVWLWAAVSEARSSRFWTRQVRRDYRATGEVEMVGPAGDLEITGISPFGADVTSSRRLEVGERVGLAFGLPVADGSVTMLEVGTVVRRSRWDGGNSLSYLRFAAMSDEDMDRVIEYCTVVAGNDRAVRRNVELAAQLVSGHPFGQMTAPSESAELEDEPVLEHETL